MCIIIIILVIIIYITIIIIFIIIIILIIITDKQYSQRNMSKMALRASSFCFSHHSTSLTVLTDTTTDYSTAKS